MIRKMITTCIGNSIVVDTSSKACLKFGVLSGDRLYFREKNLIGFVDGVSESAFGNGKVVWLTFEGKSGATCFEKIHFTGFVLPDACF